MVIKQLMILVDDAGGIFPAINHSPWDGVTLADFVMPFFLFIVGVSLAFAYKVCDCYCYSFDQLLSLWFLIFATLFLVTELVMQVYCNEKGFPSIL